MSLSQGYTDWRHESLDYRISDQREDVDAVAVHDYLKDSYWSKAIPLQTVRRSIENSHCFSLFDEGNNQVGFSRVISDHSTFAYLSDVYVLEAHRGQGLATWMMDCILTHKDLQNLKRWLLATRDMHPLYRKFGFDSLETPDKLMEWRPVRKY